MQRGRSHKLLDARSGKPEPESSTRSILHDDNA